MYSNTFNTELAKQKDWLQPTVHLPGSTTDIKMREMVHNLYIVELSTASFICTL